MKRNFAVKITGDKALILNTSGLALRVKKLYLVYETTVTTIDERLGLRTVTDEQNMDLELKPDSKIEIPLLIPTLKRISIIFTKGEQTLREDIEV
ncbi:MAG: hypothetical protein QXV69_00615 [Sulfolobaceae archaeon]